MLQHLVQKVKQFLSLVSFQLKLEDINAQNMKQYRPNEMHQPTTFHVKQVGNIPKRFFLQTII